MERTSKSSSYLTDHSSMSMGWSLARALKGSAIFSVGVPNTQVVFTELHPGLEFSSGLIHSLKTFYTKRLFVISLNSKHGTKEINDPSTYT